MAGAASAADAKALDGKAIFQAQKCDTCHAVSSAQITATGKIKAPDLSKTEPREAAWLTKYLRKEEAKDNKKHLKAFTGSDEELGALVAWLQKQNASAKK
jgi:mono/diheme cytochrome c family protein